LNNKAQAVQLLAEQAQSVPLEQQERRLAQLAQMKATGRICNEQWQSGQRT
jgi:competence protein ComGC